LQHVFDGAVVAEAGGVEVSLSFFFLFLRIKRQIVENKEKKDYVADKIMS
jgi:hypothetical protein